MEKAYFLSCKAKPKPRHNVVAVGQQSDGNRHSVVRPKEMPGPWHLSTLGNCTTQRGYVTIGGRVAIIT